MPILLVKPWALFKILTPQLLKYQESISRLKQQSLIHLFQLPLKEKNMRVNLLKAVIYADGLSYKDALRLFDLANATPLADNVCFFVHGDAHDTKWSLQGHPRMGRG